eukprot:TRINITY_DN2196_c0_g1_i4.p1 TRINITY_DN2196_c0_g1~~TRINITY_DN2196_c0_g1_i4.p1  ORF type:complete len:140 (-),score=37.23 TRINITY_DN2196_c0_g1_i4:57-476(-)
MGEMNDAACMADGFDKIQKLPDPVPGCPNFRRVPGFKVYCCGQPTIAGFENVLNKVCGDTYPKDGPINWFLNRQRDHKDGKTNQVMANILDNKIREDLERLKKIRAHRGLRHYWGLRTRGQHTKTTGHKGKTVGVSKKK